VTDRRGVLFDVDGTLVDTAYVHTVCWAQAFSAHGFHPPMARVHRAVGMGSELLVPHVLRDDPDQGVVASVTQEHDSLFEAWYYRITALPGARALVERCAHDGLAVVLATSSRPEDLARMREVLGVDEFVTATTSSEDVDTAKPAPDIIEAALARADLVPGLAVVVGDAVWDGQSADRAGTGFVGVESGGVSADELTRAGASMVAADTLELLVRYDETPLARLGAARAGASS
jgi:beta-phosphoglucomutase-like phosphatase (HAD superfamily)